MTTGEYLAQKRKEKGFSQRALALKTNLSNATISRIEKDGVQPDAKTLSKICTALDLEPDYVFSLCGYLHCLGEPPPLISKTQKQIISELQRMDSRSLEEVLEFIKFKNRNIVKKQKKGEAISAPLHEKANTHS